jgi:hypothetical protein
VHYVPNLARRACIDRQPVVLRSCDKEDPRAELEATLRSFFAKHPKATIIPNADSSRAHGWTPAGLPARLFAPRMPRYGKRAAIDASQLTRVRLGVNNPGSMYGHTLLR